MKNVTIGQHLISGGLSGFTGAIFLQPLDLLKTRLQQGDDALKSKNTTVIWRTAQDVVRKEGLKGLWRGTGATLVRNVPGVALYMTGLTQLRAVMATSPYFTAVQQRQSLGVSNAPSVLPKLSSEGNLLAGATARVGVGFFLNPFTVLKARFESEMYAYRSLSGSLLSIMRMGPPELLRGFLASSLRDAPYAGLFVVFYEGIKRETSYFFPTVYAAGIHSFSAASAGAIATMATHPFDVIKTKMQVRSEDRYRGFTSTVLRIWTQRGVLGFFDGASLRLTRKIFSSAIGWAVFEGMLLFMQRPAS
ncbi:solute carrier family 25 member 38 [Leucogyrophana mollusca]|uniref:Solute carrier family 25 member 38 n=1 Tax=Leucogyrophana mollusca TaxID=85980 RepID=A0ACB8BGK7_9AGAM|nr:solute carrier family 25 member 38 [Leucogyrophana mollusca]